MFGLAVGIRLFHAGQHDIHPLEESRMTTWDFIIALFYHIDEQMHDIPKRPIPTPVEACSSPR